MARFFAIHVVFAIGTSAKTDDDMALLQSRIEFDKGKTDSKAPATTIDPGEAAKAACSAYWGSGANGRSDCVVLNCGTHIDGAGYVPPPEEFRNCGEQPIFRHDGSCDGEIWEDAVMWRLDYGDYGVFRNCGDDSIFDPEAQVSCKMSSIRICDNHNNFVRDETWMCPGPANTCTFDSCCREQPTCGGVTCPAEAPNKLADYAAIPDHRTGIEHCCSANAVCGEARNTYSLACKNPPQKRNYSQICKGDFYYHDCTIDICCVPLEDCTSYMGCSGKTTANTGGACAMQSDKYDYMAKCSSATCCEPTTCTTMTATMKGIKNRQAVKFDDDTYLFYVQEGNTFTVRAVDASGSPKGAQSQFNVVYDPQCSSGDAHECILSRCSPLCDGGGIFSWTGPPPDYSLTDVTPC